MISSLRTPSRPTTDPRAWTAATIDDWSTWYYPLSDRCLAALDEIVQDIRRQPCATTSVRLPEPVRAAGAGELQAARTALEAGRGFVILTGIPLDRTSKSELPLLYWLAGQLLGRPFEQNVQGTLLYDVRDTGQDLSQGARFSVTNYESSFHTDNSFGDDVLDYVGLLCINTAKAGGLSQVMSGFTVYHELREHHPEVLATLSEPFHVDRRGGVKEGQGPTARFPVIHRENDGALLYRYLRYWIQAGHDKVNQPLTPAQLRALDVLDEVLRRRDFLVEFALRPGEMFFINNRWILHNRTAFEDYPELERRRHLVRLWLQR